MGMYGSMSMGQQPYTVAGFQPHMGNMHAFNGIPNLGYGPGFSSMAGPSHGVAPLPPYSFQPQGQLQQHGNSGHSVDKRNQACKLIL